MDVVQLLGQNVRRYRKLKGLTQEQLAHRAEMERSYVSDLERGERNPSVKALGRLAEALEIEPKLLLDRERVPEME
ncbi:MAG TPA: helix-turn-helix transcriptional regulator [Allosphingosinicella sp.]|nr:helix-turn-helix transcriptional regulator [Allosphingosinicella sp.]